MDPDLCNLLPLDSWSGVGDCLEQFSAKGDRGHSGCQIEAGDPLNVASDNQKWPSELCCCFYSFVEP